MKMYKKSNFNAYHISGFTLMFLSTAAVLFFAFYDWILPVGSYLTEEEIGFFTLDTAKWMFMTSPWSFWNPLWWASFYPWIIIGGGTISSILVLIGERKKCAKKQKKN